MKRERKIDYWILICVQEGWRNEDDIIDIVFKKFRFTNLFRTYQIYKVEIYNHLLKLKEKGCIEINTSKPPSKNE